MGRISHCSRFRRANTQKCCPLTAWQAVPVVSPSQQQMAGERGPDSHRRGLRVAGVLLIVAGLVMASLARLGWLGSSTRSSARASVARPTAFGLSGVPSLRASVGGVHDGLTTIRVKITAPRGAVDMAISDDPTFGGAAWQPVASYTDVLVASAGYVEIFGRFRAKDASDFVPAITGVTVPSVADRANVAKNGVTALGMVDPAVIAVSITTPRASGAAKRPCSIAPPGTIPELSTSPRRMILPIGTARLPPQ